MPAPRFNRHDPTRADREAEFTRFLCSARDEKVLEATVDSMSARYRIDRRVIECKLSARQDAIRRRQAGEATPPGWSA